MDNTFLPKTSETYILCFRQLAAITDAALQYIEQQSWTSEADKLKSLGRVAEAVETIAALRGDTAVFLQSSRPEGMSEYQSEMYKTEDYLRSRLTSLGCSGN